MNTFQIADACEFLKNNDDFLIVTHKAPDGDTLGCGFALMHALRSMGKNANVINNNEFPLRYSFLYEGYIPQDFAPKKIICVDVADVKLLGDNLAEYKEDGAIDLCIDHHISNNFFAKNTLLDSTAAAACEIIYLVIKELGVSINEIIAKCLYTGIATDTGCFKFQSTTKRTHKIAGELIEYDIDFAKINRDMFDIKSRGRILVEATVSKNMEFFFEDKCSMIVITTKLIEESGLETADFEGLTSITLQLESIKIGLMVKQKAENSFKVSVRTTDTIDACQFCKQFGGGGHVRAAGCEILGTLDEVRKMLIDAVEKVIAE